MYPNFGAKRRGYRCLWYEVDGKNSTTIKMSFIWQIPLKEGIGGERRPKDRVVKTGLLYG
jgi:hypothetical protein